MLLTFWTVVSERLKSSRGIAKRAERLQEDRRRPLYTRYWSLGLEGNVICCLAPLGGLIGMALLARIIYQALARKERKRARALSAACIHQPQKSTGERGSHLETGRRGERLAYWYLRRMGYQIVARNLRGSHGAAELDLVAWEGPVLAFVEVKTRTSREAGPPETAVSFAQQKRITAAAETYMRGLKYRAVNYRFDIVSVAWHQTDGYQLRLIKDAFKG